MSAGSSPQSWMASYVCLPVPTTGALAPLLSVAPSTVGASAQVSMNFRLEVLIGGSILLLRRAMRCCRLPNYALPQISPTVKPFGKGSSGSTTYCAKPGERGYHGGIRAYARLFQQASREGGPENAFVDEILVQSQLPLGVH